ncbi:MAG: GNAT family N-acetyltransferase [Bacteroidia bacterium]|nr:GNAT family N-acetyltransferase [Bacteroidia bacterium]
MSITVQPVSGSAGTRKFIKLQWKFYQGDRNWVPPLLMDRKKVLNTRKNPFFRHSDMQLFIAERNGEAVGRIAAIVNRNHNQTHGDKVGFFGFFECINVQEVADALFDAAANWLRAKGMDTMRGPMNPSVNDEIGMLVDGFDRPPVLLMTYNPRYYPLLVETYGFKKEKDLYAYLLRHDDVLTPKLERGQQIVRDRYGVSVRDVDFRNLARETATLKDLYNRIWEANWGAVAMTDAEFDFLANDLKQAVGKFKDLVFYLLKDGEPIGFTLFLPDLNQVLIHNSSGAILPALYHIATKTKSINLGRIIALGVLPQYRGKGLDSVMYYEVLKRAAAHGIFLGEASWVLEDNEMMNRGAKMMNAERYKTYRIYDVSI